MTNVFVLHSAITEKVSRSIIEDLGLEEVVFLTTKRYSTEEKSEAIGQLYDVKGVGEYMVKMWLEIIRGDWKVARKFGGEFHLYVPNTVFPEVRFLLSHRRCAGFSVMEEGLYSYCTREQLESMLPLGADPLRLRLASLGRLRKQQFCQDGYSRLFALTPDAFPGRDRTTVVPATFRTTQSQEGMSGDCILVCESLSFLHAENAPIYASSMVEVIQVIRERYDKVHYKIHPDSYDNWQEALLKNLIHRYGPDAEEIDRSAAIEDIAIGSGADVVLNVSSTGLYCGLYAEGDVYSFHDIFSANGEGVGVYGQDDRHANDWVPDIFWENVRLLGDSRRVAEDA
jgi:hypothetical protein